MAQQGINYGSLPEDGTGDGIREAFIKTDDNFTENYADIATNAADILTNTGDISTNTSAIAALDSIPYSIVNTGDWNMNSSGSGTDTLILAHGIADFKKIRRVTCIVRNDADTTYYPLNSVSGSGSINSWDATNVTLKAVTLGTFDTADFDSLTYNRGYMIVEYIV